MPEDPFKTLVINGFEIIKDQMGSVINNLAIQKQPIPDKLNNNYRKLCIMIDAAKEHLINEPPKGDGQPQHSGPTYEPDDKIFEGLQ